jgi:hypothetical protein
LRGNCAAARFGDGGGLTPIGVVEVDAPIRPAKAFDSLNEGAAGASERVDGGRGLWST